MSLLMITGALVFRSPGESVTTNLPAPAMLQWGRWSAMPEYFYDDPEWDARQRAGKITLPILVLGFDDDPWLIQKPSHVCLLQRKTQNRTP